VEGYQVIHEKSPAFYDKLRSQSEMQHQTHYWPRLRTRHRPQADREALTELGLKDRAILVSPVGCSSSLITTLT